MSKFRSIASVLVLSGLVVSCSDQTTSPQIDPTQQPGFGVSASPQFFPFEAVIDACGEMVDFSGSFHSVFVVTVDEGASPGPGVHIKSHINANGTGIGQSSGATWLWRDNIDWDFHFVGTPATVYTYGQTWKLIGKGQAEDFLLKVLIHYTVTPNGVEAVSVDNFQPICD